MNKENLLKAIELAESPGECKYFYKGQPSCVIGQLFVLEGAKEEEFGKYNIASISNLLDQSNSLAKYVDSYPSDLLDTLQTYWDQDLEPNETLSERKADLVELVINYGG